MNPRRAHELLSTLQRVMSPARRPNPLVVAWRWRYELTGLALVVLVAVGLLKTGPLGVVTTAGVALATVAAFARWPAARSWLVARAWCILTPHRVRVACVQARAHSVRGRLPAVLSCSPRSYGERVVLWLPAGVTEEDLRTSRHVIASACYASDVRIVWHPRYRHIVALEVVRHRSTNRRPAPWR